MRKSGCSTAYEENNTDYWRELDLLRVENSTN